MVIFGVLWLTINTKSSELFLYKNQFNYCVCTFQSKTSKIFLKPQPLYFKCSSKIVSIKTVDFLFYKRENFISTFSIKIFPIKLEWISFEIYDFLWNLSFNFYVTLKYCVEKFCHVIAIWLMGFWFFEVECHFNRWWIV